MSVGFEERINRDNEHQLLTTPPHLFYFTLARHVEKARETHRPNKRQVTPQGVLWHGKKEYQNNREDAFATRLHLQVV